MTRQEAERFIHLWFSTKTLDEFCQQFGIDKRGASNYAAYLRRKKILLPPKLPPKLKGFRGHGRNLNTGDFDTLRLLARNLTAEREAAAYRAKTVKMNGSMESLKAYVKELIAG